MRRRTTEFRILRIGLGIPQYEIAATTGIDRGRLSRIERGVEPSDPEEKERILRALGARARYMLPVASELIEFLQEGWKDEPIPFRPRRARA